MNLFKNFPVRQRPNQMLPDSPPGTFLPRNWEIPIPKHLEEKVDRNWLTETFFEEKNSAELPVFSSSKKNKPNFMFQFVGWSWSKCQLFWKCLPPMLSWWPVFGNSAHPIATSHKRTWKVGVPFWNTVGYQGDHRNPKGQCTPPMPRLPRLEIPGPYISRPNSGTRRFFNNLLPGNSGVSIVGCCLLVVIAGCSCCWWWWFCWLFLVVAKWQVVAVARPRATFWGIFWYIQTFNATNTPGRRLKGHIWHPLAYVVRRKTKHNVVKFQISLRSLKEKITCETTSGEEIYLYILYRGIRMADVFFMILWGMSFFSFGGWYY